MQSTSLANLARPVEDLMVSEIQDDQKPGRSRQEFVGVLVRI